MTINTYRTIGTTGLRVSPLALGAMNLDDGTWGSAPETCFEILDHYLDAGGNFIDTANQYNAGNSEQTFGDYFEQRPGRRDRVVLATKVGGTLHPSDPNAAGAGRKAIYTQFDGSLRQLKTDYIDLYWMHQWDRHTRSRKRSRPSMTWCGRERSGRSASRTCWPGGWGKPSDSLRHAAGSGSQHFRSNSPCWLAPLKESNSARREPSVSA